MDIHEVNLDHNAIRAVQERLEKKKKKEEKMEKPGKSKVGKCPHYRCGGSIIEERSLEFDARHGPPKLGPGGRRQWYIGKTYHCDKCLSVFTGIPKSKKVKKKSGG